MRLGPVCLLALLGVFLSGCSAKGQAFHPRLLTPESGGSTIVVYRVDQFVGKAYTARIVLDEQPMGKLKNGGFISASVAPGRHVVEIDKTFLETGGRYPTEIFTEAGQVYFVRYDQNAQMAYYGGAIGAVGYVRDGFNIVPLADALRELQGLNESR